jgi:hypothetical protein
MRLNLLSILLIIWVSSLTGFAQTPDSIAKRFLSDFQTKGIKIALQNAPKGTPITTDTKLNKIEQQFKNQSIKLGKYYGYEVIENENKVNCFIAKSYILKYQNAPSQLNLIFYKPKDKWLLQNVILKRFSNKRGRK